MDLEELPYMTSTQTYLSNSFLAVSARTPLYSKVNTCPVGCTALARDRVMQPEPVPVSTTTEPGETSRFNVMTLESSSSTIWVRVCERRGGFRNDQEAITRVDNTTYMNGITPKLGGRFQYIQPTRRCFAVDFWTKRLSNNFIVRESAVLVLEDGICAQVHVL